MSQETWGMSKPDKLVWITWMNYYGWIIYKLCAFLTACVFLHLLEMFWWYYCFVGVVLPTIHIKYLKNILVVSIYIIFIFSKFYLDYEGLEHEDWLKSIFPSIFPQRNCEVQLWHLFWTYFSKPCGIKGENFMSYQNVILWYQWCRLLGGTVTWCSLSLWYH